MPIGRAFVLRLVYLNRAYDSRSPAQCSVSGSETHTKNANATPTRWYPRADTKYTVMTTTMTTKRARCVVGPMPHVVHSLRSNGGMEEYEKLPFWRRRDYIGRNANRDSWINIMFILLWQNTAIHKRRSNWCRMKCERWPPIATTLTVSALHRFRFLFTGRSVSFSGLFRVCESWGTYQMAAQTLCFVYHSLPWRRPYSLLKFQRNDTVSATRN